MSQECKICRDAGFPNQMISFQQDGTKPDGNKRWKLLDPTGTEHIHKQQPSGGRITLSNQIDRQREIQAAHEENMRANRKLVFAINRLADAIESLSQARVKRVGSQPDKRKARSSDRGHRRKL